jgi:hypothetical protein
MWVLRYLTQIAESYRYLISEDYLGQTNGFINVY